MTATSKRAAGDMSTDFSKFSKEGIDEVAAKLKHDLGQFQYKYDCIKNKKDTFVTHFMDPLHGEDVLLQGRSCQGPQEL